MIPVNALAEVQDMVIHPTVAEATSQKASPFKDISESDWFYDSILYVFENGIFNGTGDDSFSPYETMSRSMFVTVLGRIAGINQKDYTTSTAFIDVDENAYYAPYITWALEKGVTTGVGNNRFDPDGIVTREQMAVFAVRFFDAYDIDYRADSNNFESPADISDIAPWALDSVMKLWKAGFLKGDNNGFFNPKDNAERASAATFCTRIHQGVTKWHEDNALSSQTPTPSLTPTASPTPLPSLSPSPTPTQTPVPTSTPPSDSDRNYTYYTVSFNSNGGATVDPIRVRSGHTISSLPVPIKENAIFLGWYQDEGLYENEFTKGSVVTSNITLYAKYLIVEEIAEEKLDNSFALIDQNPDLTIIIEASNQNMTVTDVENGISIEDNTGSDSSVLTIAGGNGVFTLKGTDGFIEGASYKLLLDDERLTFADQEDYVRICSFTIKKDEVYNIEFNSDIVYIPDSHIEDIVQNNNDITYLSVPLITMSEEGNETNHSDIGSFRYTGSEPLPFDIGDTLCIYSGVNPGQVQNKDSKILVNDKISYVTVTEIDGRTVSYIGASAEDILVIPKSLPIYIGNGHSLTNFDINEETETGSFTASLYSLNFKEFDDIGLSAETTINKGDFLLLSTVQFEKIFNENMTDEDMPTEDILYAKVTEAAKSGTTVSVQFELITLEEMYDSFNYHSEMELIGDQLIDDDKIEEYELQIEEQVMSSGFVDKAATYLTTLALASDDFQQIADAYGGMDSLRITMDDGSHMSPSNFRLMASSSKVKIKSPKVKASINKSPKNFNEGVRCVVSLSVTIEIKTDDDSVINIELTGDFIEEVKVSMKDDAWIKWKWKVIPTDVFFKADIDIHSYTAVSFKALVYTKGDVNSIDIVAKIKDLLGKDKKGEDEITAGVQDLYQLYTDMMENESDFIEIFSKEIIEKTYTLLKGAIQIKFVVSFVVSGDINVAIGCNYESKEATRYSFWAYLLDEESGASSVDLMKKEYSFQFYVMGRLGLRAGIKPELTVSLVIKDVASLGLEAEAGIYMNAYGFFFYEKLHKNNNNTSKSGALYYELGSYFDMALVFQAVKGKFKSSKDLIGKEWLIHTAGTRYYVYDFAYEDAGDIVFSSKNKTCAIPNDAFSMIYLDLREGENSTKAYKIGDYEVKLSDKKFTLKNGKITANVPEDTKYLEAEMTIIWKQGALAFSSVPISRTYKLIWSDLKDGYTISFDSNGGSTVNSITKKYNEKVTAPKNPTRAGYTFAGWYSDTALKQAYTFSTMGWNDIKLYAKWTPNTNTKYRVEHYQQDITNSNKYTLKETQNLTGTTDTDVSPAVKTYTGFTSPDKKTVTIAPDGSAVVEYKYNRDSYEVTFKSEKDGNSIVQTYKFGSTIKPPALSKTGHTFAGWDKTVATTMPGNNLEYTAKWNKNTYTVSFDSNGGTNPASIPVTYGSKYGTLPTPERQGYTFLGWYTSEVDNVGFGTQIKADTTVNITSSQILYAKWAGKPDTPYTVNHYQRSLEEEKYVIIFGKKVSLGTASSYVLVDTDKLKGTAGIEVTPEVKNYAGFTSPNKQIVTIDGSGSTVVNYYYPRNSYTLTIKHENGLTDLTKTVKYDDEVTLPTGLVKDGYNFKEWAPEPTGKMPAGDTTYTAVWVAEGNTPYTVKHYLEDLNNNYTLVLTENFTGATDSSITPGVKNYEGFTAPQTQTKSIAADGSTVIEYYYTRNSYKLVFMPENGGQNTVTDVVYGKAISAPVVERIGYNFSGWKPELPPTMPAADTTYKAEWNLITYSITYHLDGGENPESNPASYTIESETITLADATRTGYIFDGWVDSETGGNKVNKITKGSIGNITFYASWVADLKDWDVNGHTAKWTLENGAKSVRITDNKYISFFVSPDNCINKEITGAMKVEQESDDDLFGFVLGYQQPTDENNDDIEYYDFIVFDWKQKEQRDRNDWYDENIDKKAAAGYTLLRITAELKTQPSYHGGLGEFSKYLWFHLPETNKCEILGTKHGSGKGWEDYTEYEFKVRYTKNNITIWINGNEIFNANGDFKDGKFGFYNNSQENTVYGNVRFIDIAP
jgi:uncharacterized repeat protein (TIGR02543 family)